MSRVLIDSATVTALANKIRRKTATANKLRMSDMLERMNMLQGHLSSAYALSIDPMAYPESVYTPAFAFVSGATKRTDYIHSEVDTTVGLTDYTFVSTAASAE